MADSDNQYKEKNISADNLAVPQDNSSLTDEELKALGLEKVQSDLPLTSDQDEIELNEKEAITDTPKFKLTLYSAMSVMILVGLYFVMFKTKQDFAANKTKQGSVKVPASIVEAEKRDAENLTGITDLTGAAGSPANPNTGTDTNPSTALSTPGATPNAPGNPSTPSTPGSTGAKTPSTPVSTPSTVKTVASTDIVKDFINSWTSNQTKSIGYLDMNALRNNQNGFFYTLDDPTIIAQINDYLTAPNTKLLAVAPGSSEGSVNATLSIGGETQEPIGFILRKNGSSWLIVDIQIAMTGWD